MSVFCRVFISATKRHSLDKPDAAVSALTQTRKFRTIVPVIQMSEQKTSSPVAIIDLGGKQHVVSRGSKIQVNRLETKEGEMITAKDILTGATIQLKVVNHFLGKKINGLKFKNKIRYIRHYGHRQHLTALEVLATDTAKPKAESKAADKPAVKKVAPKKAAVKKETK